MTTLKERRLHCCVLFVTESGPCTICGEDVETSGLYVRRCRHGYHTECLETCLETSRTCPICHEDITETPAKDSNPILFTAAELARSCSLNMYRILHQSISAEEAFADYVARHSLSTESHTSTKNYQIQIAYSKCVAYAASGSRTPEELRQFQSARKADLHL
jgi:hypothetical protein